MPQRIAMENWFDTVAPKIPGVLGSALACTWMQGTWRRKLTLVIGGAAAAFYLGPWVAEMTGWPGEVVGFVTGMFSMAAADVVFRSAQALMIGSIVNDWLRHILRLPPKGGRDA